MPRPFELIDAAALIAREFGWTPATILELTPGQFRLWYDALIRLLEREGRIADGGGGDRWTGPDADEAAEFARECRSGARSRP